MNAIDHRCFDDGGDDLQSAVAVRAVPDIPTKRQEAASRQRRFLAYTSNQLKKKEGTAVTSFDRPTSPSIRLLAQER